MLGITRSVYDLVEEFLDHLEAQGLSPTSRKVARSRVRSFLRFIAALLPTIAYDRISHKTVEAWMLHMKRVEDKDARTINSYLSAIRGIYTYWKREGYVVDNPARDVRSMKVKRLLPKPYSLAEIEAILAVTTDPQERALWETYYSTGCRTGEVYGMRIGDLDLEAATACVFGKGQKERMVELGEPAIAALRAWLQIRQAAGERLLATSPLWIHRWRGRLWPMRERIIRDRLRAAAVRAGVIGKKNPHRFRHSFCTHLLDGGADLRKVQELAGHDSIQTTTIYTFVSNRQKRETFRSAHPRARMCDKVDPLVSGGLNDAAGDSGGPGAPPPAGPGGGQGPAVHRPREGQGGGPGEGGEGSRGPHP